MSKIPEASIEVIDFLETCSERTLIVGRKPMVMRAEDLLKILGSGYMLVQRKNLSAAWLMKPNGQDAGYSVNHTAIRELIKHNLIENHGDQSEHLVNRINKRGVQELERREQKAKKTTFITPKQEIKPIIPKKEEPTPPKTEENKKLNIKATTIQTGKREFVMTLVITSYETLETIKSKLGLGEHSIPQETIPTLGGRVHKNCFYCQRTVEVKTSGKQAWRVCCKEKDCRKKYDGDTKTRLECKKAGIEIEE